MTTKKTSHKKREGDIPAAGIAAGVLVAAAAAGATYYFYGSKHAKKHRKEAALWAKEMKRDIVREAKKLQKLDEVVMHDIIDRVAGTYEGGKATAEEVRRAVGELKQHWKKVRAEASGSVRTARAAGKKVAARAKKTIKKRA